MSKAVAKRKANPLAPPDERETNYGVVVAQDSTKIIKRIENGEYAAHIAKEIGVSKQALQKWIRNHPEYQQAREVGAELRIDSVMAELAGMTFQTPPKKPIATGDEDTDKQALNEWKAAMVDWKNGLRASEVDLARVERLWRTVSWQAEREFPHRWGQKNHLVVENVGDLGEKLRRAKERVINPVVAEQQGNNEHSDASA